MTMDASVNRFEHVQNYSGVPTGSELVQKWEGADRRDSERVRKRSAGEEAGDAVENAVGDQLLRHPAERLGRRVAGEEDDAVVVAAEYLLGGDVVGDDDVAALARKLVARPVLEVAGLGGEADQDRAA